MLLGPMIHRYIELVLQCVWLAQSVSIFGGAHSSDQTLVHENCLTKFALIVAIRSSPSPPTSRPDHDRQVPLSPQSLFDVRVAVVTNA
jgi:hypothetical protein